MVTRQCSDSWDSRYEKLAILEFNRDRKSMSVLCRPRSSDEKNEKNEKIENRLFVKGAAEVVSQRCNRLKLENGRIVPITPVIRAQLDEKVGVVDPP